MRCARAAGGCWTSAAAAGIELIGRGRGLDAQRLTRPPSGRALFFAPRRDQRIAWRAICPMSTRAPRPLSRRSARLPLGAGRVGVGAPGVGCAEKPAGAGGPGPAARRHDRRGRRRERPGPPARPGRRARREPRARRGHAGNGPAGRGRAGPQAAPARAGAAGGGGHRRRAAPAALARAAPTGGAGTTGTGGAARRRDHHDQERRLLERHQRQADRGARRRPDQGRRHLVLDRRGQVAGTPAPSEA